MKTVKIIATVTLLLIVGPRADAEIILTVIENLSDPTPDLDLQVDVELVGVGGGGLGSLGVGVVTDGAVSAVQGFDWSTMIFFGSSPDGSLAEWGDFGPGPTDGVFSGILTFAVSDATGVVTLGGPDLDATDDTFAVITDTIVVNPYVIPEPSTALLLAGGLIGLVWRGRSERRSGQQ